MGAGSVKWPLLVRLTTSLVDAEPDLAQRMATAIRTEVPFYRPGSSVAASDIDASTVAHMEALVALTFQPDDRDAAPRDLGERRARDGVDIADVQAALRVGTKFLWEAMVDHARRTSAASDSELVELASEVWLMHDAYVQAMTEGYRQEHARVLLDRQQERLGIVYGLLTARAREAASPWAAIDRLGLPRAGGFVVVAVAGTTIGRMPIPGVEFSLASAGVTSAWVLISNVQLGIVSTADASWWSVLETAASATSATVGVSPKSEDFAEIGHVVRLARIALSAAPAATVLRFEAAPVAMAAAGSPDVTELVVRDVLRELVDQPEGDRAVLFETLEAWFRSDGSVSSVSTALDVHENTVRNRLRRISALTGRDISRPRDAAEVYLALVGYNPSES